MRGYQMAGAGSPGVGDPLATPRPRASAVRTDSPARAEFRVTLASTTAARGPQGSVPGTLAFLSLGRGRRLHIIAATQIEDRTSAAISSTCPPKTMSATPGRPG